jgi:hypothetical protein
VTTPEPLDPPLGDRLRRLTTWADAVPPEHQHDAARLIDLLAVRLADIVARPDIDHDLTDPMIDQLTQEAQ